MVFLRYKGWNLPIGITVTATVRHDEVFFKMSCSGIRKEKQRTVTQKQAKADRRRKQTGNKIASKRKEKKEREVRIGERTMGRKVKMWRKKGKIDGKALAANATLAFSGLVGENFHHRLFFCRHQCQGDIKSCDYEASGNRGHINNGGRALSLALRKQISRVDHKLYIFDMRLATSMSQIQVSEAWYIPLRCRL